MEELESERTVIERQFEDLTREQAPLPAIPHPRIAEAYRRRVEDLEAMLDEDSTDAREALGLVRSLIERVEIDPDAEAPNGLWLEIRGDLAQLLSFSEAGKQKPPKAFALDGSQLSVDAGTGFEPVTFRL